MRLVAHAMRSGGAGGDCAVERRDPLAADDEELERLVLAHSKRLRAILETARQQIREGQGISHETLWQEMEEEKPRKRTRKGSIPRSA